MFNNLVSIGKTFVQSVSICPTSRRGCSGKCKSCIAQMTPGAMTEVPEWAPMNRVKDILDYGRQAGAMTAIITSKSEPTLDFHADPERFLDIMKACRERIPQLDIHTNALYLYRHPDVLKMMVEEGGLNMLTISLASFNPEVNEEFMGFPYEPEKVIKMARDLDIMVRCSVLLTKETCRDGEALVSYIYQALQRGVGMVVARELWLPAESSNPNEIEEWCRANFVDMAAIEDQFMQIATKIPGGPQTGSSFQLPIRLLRHLPWGTPIFDVGGMNVTFARCDEKPAEGVFKSLQLVPFLEADGKVDWCGTTQWGSRASRIL